MRHPVFEELNASVIVLNERLPGAARGSASFESRPAARPPHAWGAFVGVAPPEGPLGPWPEGGSVSAGACWNLSACPLHVSGNALFESDETRVVLAPSFLALRPWSTDEFVIGVARWGQCGVNLSIDRTCTPALRIRPLVEPLLEPYLAATPDVRLDLGISELTLLLDTVGSAGGDAPTPGTPGALVAPAGAPARFTRASTPARLATFFGELRLEDAATGASGRAEGGGFARQPDAPSLEEAGAAFLGFLFAVLLAAWLYHRIVRAEVLEQATRRRVFDAIWRDPGIRMATIAGLLGLDYTTVRYHVRRLEEPGLVRGVGSGQKAWFAAGHWASEEVELRALVGTAMAVALYRWLQAHGPTDVSGCAAGIGVSLPTVTRAAARLTRAGMILREREGKRVMLRAEGKHYREPGAHPHP